MKGKIIIAFLLVALALGVMWVVNKVALEKIADIVTDLSAPNDKLLHSRKLFTQVSNLPHLQRLEVMKGKRTPSPLLVRENRDITRNIRTLDSLLADEPAQQARVDSIRTLMRLSNRLFLDYLRLGFSIGEKKVFEKELNAISEKIDSGQAEIDSSIVTSNKKVKTTTIIHPDTTIKATPKRSWIKRIFSKPKKETAMVATQPKVIIEEESNTTIDTVTLSKDSSLEEIGSSLRKLEQGRVKRTNQLRESEEELLKANDVLLHQVMGILNEVERGELENVREKTGSTKEMANETIYLTRFIMVLFIIVALVLVAFLLADLARSRTYRRDLELAKQEAEYHSLAKQRFLTNMSHEIRTPLQSIIGYTEQQLLDGKPSMPAIQAVHSSSQHLLQIVNEVLDYSRITSGKFTFEERCFCLKQVIEEIIPGMQLLAEQKGLNLIVNETKHTEAIVKGDPFRLKQVLYNLLGNAVKFTTQGSVSLAVKGNKTGDNISYEMAVEDTGVGIEAAEIPHIFKQFEQSGNPLVKLQTGTGLGLSIVKELVEAQGGSISVSSEPGKGSKFTVVMEYPVDHTVKSITNVQAVENVTADGTVWMVDDDPMILNLAAIIFKKHGIPHRVFSSAEELLEEPWDEEVSYVFSDIRLPGMNGTGLCRELRKWAPEHLKIIALTAQALPEERQPILDSGFDELLIKPFTEAGLVNLFQHTPASKPALLNIALLRQMVGDDKQLIGILQQCYDDTVADKDELLKVAETGDNETGSLIIHRLAGRVGQVGDKALASELRAWEHDFRATTKTESMHAMSEEITPRINKFLQSLKHTMHSSA